MVFSRLNSEQLKKKKKIISILAVISVEAPVSILESSIMLTNHPKRLSGMVKKEETQDRGSTGQP